MLRMDKATINGNKKRKGARPPLQERHAAAVRSALSALHVGKQETVGKFFRLRFESAAWLQDAATEKGMSEVALLEALIDAARRVQADVDVEVDAALRVA
jgi:hypothetical protein